MQLQYAISFGQRHHSYIKLATIFFLKTDRGFVNALVKKE